MIRDLVRADNTLIEKILDLGVVLGTADQSALPEKIKARIADMRPIRIVGLNDARHASRSRRLQHRELAGIRSQGLMCADHRILKELERILECRFRFLLEALDEQPDRDLRGDFATCMAAHAVSHHQQQRVAAVRIREAVLVDLALTLSAFLKDRKAHAPPTSFR